MTSSRHIARRFGCWLIIVMVGCGGEQGPPPEVVVTGSTIDSSAVGFRLALPEGWTVEAPRQVKRRVEIEASNKNVQLRAVLQRMPSDQTSTQLLDRMLSQLDRSEYSDQRRGAIRVGAVDGDEHASVVSKLIPQLLVLAIRDRVAVSFVCTGSHATCRETIARATWH